MSLKSLINVLSEEKDLSKDLIFNTIRDSIFDLVKNKYKFLSIDIILNNDEFYSIYIIYSIVKKTKYDISPKYPFNSIPLNYLYNYNYNFRIGDKLRKDLKLNKFYILNIQRNKDFIIKKLQELQELKELRDDEVLLIDNFKDRLKKIVFGIVKYTTKKFVVVDLNGFRGVLFKENCLLKDYFNRDDKIKALFKDISHTSEFDLILSRNCNEFLLELLKLEIPEIKNGLVKVVGVARDVGVKSKISLKSENNKLDPVSICIGIKGTRINNISKQLCGEKIDLIAWNEEVIKYVINIFSDIEIGFIEVYKYISLIVLSFERTNYFKVIKKNFQIVRFARKLTGWTFKVIKKN